jgi:anti-sigma factor RsiW
VTTHRPFSGAGALDGGPHVRELLSAYVDDALAPDAAAAVAEHLTACAECSAAYEATLRLVGTLRETLVRHPAPDLLRQRVRATLRDAANRGDAATNAPGDGGRSAPRPAWRPPRWGLVAASLALIALSSTATWIAADKRSDGARVRDEVFASHIRSLMPGHLTDVQSNDRHNVKPWFAGRIDFSPAVPPLDDHGFPLLGGRLDYVGGRPVSVVVYGRRQHVINLYAWPADGGGSGLSAWAATGFHALRWRERGVELWAVSDLNAADLQEFVRTLRQVAR